MKDERSPLEPADEEELRSAAALARALEGGADEPDLPQPALETAALLRLHAGAALDPERRAAIKDELLAALPARSQRRRRSPLLDRARAVPRWLWLALPLGGTALMSLLLLVKPPEPESSAARSFAVPPPSEAAASADERTALAPESPEDGAREAAPTRAPAAAAPQLPAQPPQLAPPEARSLAARKATRAEAAGDEEAWRGPSDARAKSAANAPSARRAARATGAEGHGAGALGRGGLRGDALAARDRPAPAAALSAPGAGAPSAAQPGARAALTGLDQQVRAERGVLLARVNDAALARAHAELDGARSRGELQRSRADLLRLLETAGAGLAPDDARHVRQDLYCRLAETALRLGEARSALEWSRRGIELDGPPSPFLAQLMALEGDALAALGEPTSAASSYLRALRVHEALLDESLDGR